MKIGLIQVDGKLPNLALMKLSRYHKEKGDEIVLIKSKDTSMRLTKFDKVYISCIFEENKEKAITLSKNFKNCEIGGVGVNHITLPPFIEHSMPDYDTFKCDYSLGFTTRGCIRKCKFCKVPEHEGRIRPNCDIYEFWDERHKHLVLMDNNILALPKHFKKISSQILKEELTVDFNQGLDIRLLNDEKAKTLKKLRTIPEPRFSWDNMEIEPQVLKGIKILRKHGINRAMWFCLVGFNTTLKQDLYRLNLLKKHNQNAYVMRYKTCNGNKVYSDLAAWVNQHNIFQKMTFEEFKRERIVLGRDKEPIDRFQTKLT